MNQQFQMPSAPITTQAAEGLPRWAWTIAEVEAMMTAGIIKPDARFEMIGGEIVPMSPKGTRHEGIKRKLNYHLQQHCPTGHEISQETTVRFDDRSFLEPDFCVHRWIGVDEKLFGYDTLLAIEVSDTTLAYDLGRKIGLYTAFGIREVWVINARTLVTRVHRHPGVSGYGEIIDIPSDQIIAAETVPGLAVRLADLGLEPASESTPI